MRFATEIFSRTGDAVVHLDLVRELDSEGWQTVEWPSKNIREDTGWDWPSHTALDGQVSFKHAGTRKNFCRTLARIHECTCVYV